jgi:hypothetical protein
MGVYATVKFQYPRDNLFLNFYALNHLIMGFWLAKAILAEQPNFLTTARLYVACDARGILRW